MLYEALVLLIIDIPQFWLGQETVKGKFAHNYLELAIGRKPAFNQVSNA